MKKLTTKNKIIIGIISLLLIVIPLWSISIGKGLLWNSGIRIFVNIVAILVLLVIWIELLIGLRMAIKNKY